MFCHLSLPLSCRSVLFCSVLVCVPLYFDVKRLWESGSQKNLAKLSHDNERDRSEKRECNERVRFGRIREEVELESNQAKACDDRWWWWRCLFKKGKDDVSFILLGSLSLLLVLKVISSKLGSLFFPFHSLQMWFKRTHMKLRLIHEYLMTFYQQVVKRGREVLHNFANSLLRVQPQACFSLNRKTSHNTNAS